MLGRAVSSSRPTDCQPRSHMGAGVWPATKRQAEAGVQLGWPYSAVGMHRAVESAIGLPSRSTSASRMLAFVTPPDVSSSFKMPPGLECDLPGGVQTREHRKTHRLPQPVRTYTCT